MRNLMKNSSDKLSIREIIATSRPVSWINTAAPFLVGYLITIKSLDVTAIVGTIYFLFPYNLLMYGVNDIYDYESDIKNPRKNSVEGAILAKEKHSKLWLAIILANLPFIVYFLTIGSSMVRIGIILLTFLCLSYSAKPLRFKEIPFLDALNSSLHFVGPFIFGLMFAGAINNYWPAIVAFLCWGMASQAFGSIQDIKPDRAAKINSIGTVLGAKRTNTFSLIMYAITCVITLIFYLPAGIIVAILLSVYALNVLIFRKYKSDARSNQYHRGWQNFMWLNIIVGFGICQILLFAYDPLGISQSYILLFGFFLLMFFLAQLGLTIYNIRAFVRPSTKRLQEWPKISIIMHAYNQQDNISSTLLAVLGQQYPHFEIIFTDLGSSDNTRKIAESFQDPRLKIVETKPIEAGWTLNAWVSQQLLKESTGDIVVLIGADTILLANSLSIIAGLIKHNKLSLVSILPADQNQSIAQQIILSQNHYFMLGLFPSAYIAKTRPKSVNASGSLMAFVRSSVMSLGGFELVRKSPLEDFDLAAAVKSKGLDAGFYLGTDIATSQNHSSLRLIVAQNIRRFYPALHFSMPLTISLFLGGIFVLVVPSLLVIFLIFTNAYVGIWLLVLAIGLSYINRLVITIISKQSIISTLLYPIGVFLSLCLLLYSMLNYELFKPRWQKRTEVF